MTLFQKIFFRIFTLSIAIFIASGEIYAGESGVIIRNYLKQEYQAASQNWSVAQDSKGYLYFANNVGLLEFDGIIWTFYRAPKGAVIRAVAVDEQNRIFTAGYRELGYWLRNEMGKLDYHSLKQQVEENFTANEEFWNVIIQKDKVYFQSFSKIYIYHNQEFQIIKPEGFINSMSDGGNRIFVNLMNEGVYQIDGAQLKPYLVSDFFRNKEIRFILSISQTEKLIGTANDGLLYFNGTQLREWQPTESEYFRKNIINRGCISGDGKIIIGTILDGISVFDRSGHLLNRFNKGNGLQNNTVLGIIADNNQNIWAGLDKGIDFISLTPDPSYTIVERKEIGAVYSAAVYQNQLFLGTNQGVYSRPNDQPDEPFRLVPETQGQVWDCKVFDDRLFISHNKGTFVLSKNQLREISNHSGGFSLTENPLVPGQLVQSTYSNLIFYQKTNDQWKVDHILYSFNDLIRYIEVDHLGNFWAGHMYRGIFRLKFDSRDSLAEQRYYGQQVFGKDHGIHVFKVENRIVFTTGEKLYTFDDLNDTIIEYAGMNEKLANFRKATRIIAAPDHRYWLITDQSCGLFKIENSEVRLIKEYPTSLFNNQLITGYENIVPLDETKALLCLENGYAILNTDTVSPASRISKRTPELRQISISGSNDRMIDLPVKADETTIHFNRNNVQLQYSFPYFSSDHVKYLSFIEGLDQKWSEPVDKPIFSFKRLPVGHYKIKVKAMNSWGEFSQEQSFKLTVLPPWYRSTLAYVGYVLLVVGGLLLFRRSVIRRTKLKESREREEQEKELIKLRNDKLQAELSFKSSELASSTMAIIKKNEFLMDMKEMLASQKEQLGTRYPDKYYERLITKIDENISSQDDWKVFETNFERAHEQFMKTLKDNYHDLTPSDLRLCAFLRMNLSSKEIAPLLGISVRGVENHRYRVRKKLNLEADDSLTEFIIKL